MRRKQEQRSMLELELIKLIDKLDLSNRLIIAKKIHSYGIYKLSEYPDGMRVNLSILNDGHLNELLDTVRLNYDPFHEPYCEMD